MILKRFESGVIDKKARSAMEENRTRMVRSNLNKLGVLSYAVDWCELNEVPMTDILYVTMGPDARANRVNLWKALASVKCLTYKEIANIFGVTQKQVSETLSGCGRYK